MVREVEKVTREWAQSEIARVVERDMDAMEQSVQALQRLVGRVAMETLVEAGVARHHAVRPDCPQCERPMRLVDQQRRRQMQGLVGDFVFSRPYYQCRMCGGGIAPDDERLGLGTVSYTPALSRVAALMVAEVPFRASCRNLSETLGVTFAEADICRVTEAIGAVAEAEIQTGIAAPPPPPGVLRGHPARRGGRHHELH